MTERTRGRIAIGGSDVLSADLSLTQSIDDGRSAILDTQFTAPAISANVNIGQEKFSALIGSDRIEGLFGGRLVHADETLGAYEEATINGVVGPPTFETIHSVSTKFLPSLNTRLTLVRGLFLRFTSGRSLTRPAFAEQNPSLTLKNAGRCCLAPEQAAIQISAR